MDTEFAEEALVGEGGVFLNGRHVASDFELARNQFGYELGYTWREIAQIGASIWVERNGVIWCDDPERVPGRFVEQMVADGEMYRRIVVDPEVESKEDLEKIAAFWSAHLPEGVAVAKGRCCIEVRL